MAPLQHSEAAPSTGDFRTAVALAALLQRVDSQPARIGAQQYRSLVQQLARQLDQLPPGDALQRLLASFPAAATLYENQHYAHAGLCRAPLEQSLDSELAARRLIEKLQAARG